MQLRSLVYHRIEDPASARSDLAPDPISASPATFEWHVGHLRRFYQPVGADQVLAALDCHHQLPKRAVLVTFDDGYRDFLDVAWPILKRHGVPVILFVSTAFVDEPNRIFWWDALWQILHWTSRRRAHVAGQWVYPLRTLRERTRASREIAESLKTLAPGQRAACVERLAEQLDVAPQPTRAVLSWAELRQLAAEGVTVAGHSRTHELLDQIDDEALRREVAGCRADLQRELGYCQPLFAYPNGNLDERTVAAIDAAGFRAGFTTAHGLNRLCASDARLLRRDDGRVSPIRLVLNLLGPVARARAMRHPQPAYPWTG